MVLFLDTVGRGLSAHTGTQCVLSYATDAREAAYLII